MSIEKNKLQIWFTELSKDFYAIRLNGEKIYSFDDIREIMGINPYPLNESELNEWIESSPNLFEQYAIETVYFDVT